MEAVAAGGIKGVIGAVSRPIVGELTKQWKNRGATEFDPTRFATIDPELDAALDLLTGDSTTLLQAAKQYCQRTLAQVPEGLQTVKAREWLRSDDVRDILKASVRNLIAQESWQENEEAAKAIYHKISGDFEWYGGVLFDWAVAFMALYLLARLSPGERLAAENSAKINSKLDDGFSAVLARLPSNDQNTLTAPTEAVDHFLAKQLENQMRFRAIGIPEDQLRDATEIAQRAFDGDLSNASSSLKILACTNAASVLARNGQPDEADGWIDRAVGLGANDIYAERARVAIARKDWDAALKHLEGREDALAASLQLDVLQRRDGSAAAITFFEKFYASESVNGFALASISHWMAELDRLDDAERLLSNATADQISENPNLLFSRMNCKLALCAPKSRREGILKNWTLPPSKALRDDSVGKNLRRGALADSQALLAEMNAAGTKTLVEIVEQYEFYLRLSSPDQIIAAKAGDELLVRLSSPDTTIFSVPLATAFDIQFDTGPLEKQLERTRLLGGWDRDHLRAAVNLEMRKDSPQAVVDFFTAHEGQLMDVLGSAFTLGIFIEALAKSGRLVEARKKLADHVEELTASEFGLLDGIISEQGGGNDVDIQLANYEASNDDRDLSLLVRALQKRKDKRLVQYAPELWRRTRIISEAVDAAHALHFFGLHVELQSFLSELGSTVEENDQLSIYAGWCAYWRGDVNEAQERVDTLRQKLPNDSGLRQLALNVALERGTWRSLGPLLDADLDQRDNRTAQELLQAANLASLIRHPNSMALAEAGVEKEPENPNILLAAFGVAIQQGQDWGDTAGAWLRKAIQLSDEDGPIQSTSLQDILQMREEYVERATELDQLIMSSSVTLSMAAKPLNTCLSELVLDRLAQNPEQENPLNRVCLPFFSGNRLPLALQNFGAAAFDPASILMLHNLGLLEDAFEAFDSVVLPAETLPFFFYDLVNADKGQPSRAARARDLKRFISDKKIKILDEASLERANVCSDDDVDVLFSAAEANDGAMIHNSPIYAPGTLMERELDVTALLGRLVSCGNLANALVANGDITNEHRAVCSKWQNFDDGWPSEPTVRLDKPLFVNGLAINHLQNTNILTYLCRQSREIYVRQQVIDLAEAEIREQEHKELLREKIEAVCDKLRSALATGKARIAPTRSMRDRDDDGSRDGQPEPQLSVLHNAGGADVLISDDRVLNRYPQATDQTGAEIPIATSLDVIDLLFTRAKMTEASWLGVRQKLRESGVAFIPVTTVETLAAMKQGNWLSGPPRPALAIRDSIHLPLLRDALVLPVERHWLEHLVAQLTFAIRRCFAELQPDVARKAAKFIWECIPDIQSLAKTDDQSDAEIWADNIVVATYCLMAMPLSLSGEQAKNYHDWFAQQVSPKLNGRHKALRQRVIDGLCHSISQSREVTELAAEDGEVISVSPMEIAKWQMAHLPLSLFQEVIKSDEVQIATGRTDAKHLSIGDHSVSMEALRAFCLATFAGEQPELIDENGNEVGRDPIANDDGSISFSEQERLSRFGEAGLFSPKRKHRIAGLSKLLEGKTVAAEKLKYWITLASYGHLSENDFLELLDVLSDSPQRFLNKLTSEMSKEDFAFDDFLPTSEAYFENLLGFAPSTGTFDQTVKQFGAMIRRVDKPIAAMFLTAPFAIAPTVAFGKLTNSIAKNDLVKLCEQLLVSGDPFSIVAAFQIVCENIENDALKRLGSAAIDLVLNDDSEFDTLVHNFCAAARLSLGVAATGAILDGWPPSVKRLTLLAHAGHIARVLHQFDVKQPEFLEQVQESGGGQFDLAEMLLNAQSRRWQHSFLSPDLIKAYIVRRLSAEVEGIETARRPQTWSKRIKAYVDRLTAKGSLAMLSFPGPLDEFSKATDKRSRLDNEAFGMLIKLLNASNPFGGIDCLFVFSAIAQRPSKKQATELREALIGALGRLDQSNEQRARKAILSAACNWRLPQLADDVLNRFVEDRQREPSLNVVEIFETIVAAAMVTDNPDEQANRVREGLHRFVFTRPMKELAGRLRQGLDVALNLKPSFAQPLSKLRAAALLQQ